MKETIIGSFGKVAWALAFSALPAISIYGIDPLIRDCMIFGMLLFTGHLILMKLNEVLAAIKGKDSAL